MTTFKNLSTNIVPDAAKSFSSKDLKRVDHKHIPVGKAAKAIPSQRLNK